MNRGTGAGQIERESWNRSSRRTPTEAEQERESAPAEKPVSR
jgi:hypothetical protein